MRTLLAVTLIGLLACGDSSAPADGGVDAASPDGGPTDSGPGDTGPGDAGEPDAALPPPPPAEPGRHDVDVIDTRLVVPSDGLPPDITPLTSNNNLDVIRHDGRVYLVWRTSPDHFAGPETVMHVVSSDDELTWVHEASFSRGTDLREPRFLEVGGSLFLYMAVLGADRFAFEPMGVIATERSADGTWSEPVDIGLPGYIAWRTRTEDGTPYMTAYLGGEHIYRFDGIPLSVDLLTTADGWTWTPADPARRTIYMGGGSETDFVLGDDGTLFGVIRNEAGDDTGWGSEVCRADPGDIAGWRCVIDPRKYDSPLMFWYDGEAYLVARRNLTETGNYDLMLDTGTAMWRTIQYETDYSNQPKRCSLWRYVQDEDRIAFVLDLPSNGDTCFAGRLSGDSPDEVILYNYSSDIDAPPRSWSEGQRMPTFIYRHVLRFTPR